ncbi:MAG: type II toxin-antitoxin system tRNA(fMet)-specific endonuclease VapC [Thermodesulfobacteriota bacterium]
MTEYMLDTNMCIAIMKGHPNVCSKIISIDPSQVSISGIVLAELTNGVCKSVQKKRNQKALKDFCSMCTIFDWPAQAADTYGQIRASLEKQERAIGANDLLIAAHAKHMGMILITNNTREFERVPGLHIEDWSQ